jgi:hypothetical protein
MFINFSTIYPNEGLFSCCFCNNRQRLPSHLHNISRDNPPTELKYQTVEYIIPQPAVLSPSLVIVVDTCLPKSEFIALKQLLVCFCYL